MRTARKQRVLAVGFSTENLITGAEAAFDFTCEVLSDSGFTVVAIKIRGASSLHLRVMRACRSFFTLLAHIRSVDVVYLNVSKSRIGLIRDLVFAGASTLLKRRRVRLVAHLHSAGYAQFMESSPIVAQMALLLLRVVDEFIVLCEADARCLAESLAPALCGRIGYLENAVPDLPGRVVTSKDSVNRHDSSPRVLGYIGAIRVEKGVETALSCFLKARETIRNLELHIAGEVHGTVTVLGKRCSSNEQFRVAVSAIEGVTYTGAVRGAAKDRFFSRIDVLLFPSTYAGEGMPLVVLEALRGGVVPIVTDIGCTADAVAKLNPGLVCKQSERLMEDLLSKTLALSAAPGFEELSRACRRHYEQRFSEEIYRQRLLDLFKNDS